MEVKNQSIYLNEFFNNIKKIQIIQANFLLLVFEPKY